MTSLVLSVFIASLFGSLHCAGMCGAFVAFAVGDSGQAKGQRLMLNAAYHGGRLTTYALLGAVAGSVGALLDLGGALAGISRVAMVLAGAVMVLFGLSALSAALGRSTLRFPIPSAMQRVLSAGHRAAMGFSPVRRALTIGLLTTFLPCGWLYAFAAVAAGTASPFWGAITMAVFWLGTLPVLVSLGVGVQKLTGVLGKHLPHATAVMLIAVGIWALIGRGMLNAEALADSQSVFENLDDAKSGVQAASQSDPACCGVKP